VKTEEKKEKKKGGEQFGTKKKKTPVTAEGKRQPEERAISH